MIAAKNIFFKLPQVNKRACTAALARSLSTKQVNYDVIAQKLEETAELLKLAQLKKAQHSVANAAKKPELVFPSDKGTLSLHADVLPTGEKLHELHNAFTSSIAKKVQRVDKGTFCLKLDELWKTSTTLTVRNNNQLVGGLDIIRKNGQHTPLLVLASKVIINEDTFDCPNGIINNPTALSLFTEKFKFSPTYDYYGEGRMAFAMQKEALEKLLGHGLKEAVRTDMKTILALVRHGSPMKNALERIGFTSPEDFTVIFQSGTYKGVEYPQYTQDGKEVPWKVCSINDNEIQSILSSDGNIKSQLEPVNSSVDGFHA